MSVRTVRLVGAVAILVGGSIASADEGDLVEKIAVRNRLFTPAQRFELGLHVGLPLLTRLTDHYVFQASGAYNVWDWLAVELRLGYAYSRHTALADQIQADFSTNTTRPLSDDLADLWEMTFHGVAGVRFQPIYGKINLMAELPVHFQVYLWLGVGGGVFNRESLVLCSDRPAVNNCSAYLREVKGGPLVSAAVGFRFWITPRHALRLEAREFSFLDSYYLRVQHRNSTQTLGPDDPATGSAFRGLAITSLSQLDLGYDFVF